MQLHRLPITAVQLATLPNEDRALAVFLGHAMNELNVLIKLFDMATAFESDPRVLGNAHVCQAMVLARTAVGKLYETWDALKNGYFGTKLSKTYSDRLDAEGIDGLAHLKAYFSNKNTVGLVRNKFAFHFSLEHAAHTVATDTPTEDLSIYLGPNNGTTLYQFAEYTMASSLIDAIDPKDGPAGFQKLIEESGKAVSAFNAFAQRLLYAILERHNILPADPDALERVDIGPVAKKDDVRIPFFFE